MDAIETRTERAERRAVPGRRRAAPLAAGLLLALGLSAPLLAEGFALPEDLAGHAVLSCGELTLSGGVVVTSEGLRTGSAEGGRGHVRSNRGVVLDGGVTVHGDAVAGPGFQVTFNGQPSQVDGSTGPADEPFDCTPVDLAAERSLLEAANDNAALPRTAKGEPALGGADGRALALTGRDSLVLPAGSYLLSELSLHGNSSIAVDGPVRILVTGPIDVQGGSHLNLDGDPFDLRIWSAGDAVSIASQSVVHGFLYAPAAEVTLSGRSRLAGALQADRVEIAGGARVRRVIDDVAPVLEVSSPVEGELVERCEIAVTGRATDAEGTVEVTVDGVPVTTSSEGDFTATTSLWTQDPGLVVVEAVDRAGNRSRVEVRVEIVPPEAALLTPAPGSLVGQRIVDLSGRAGTATELTVSGAPAELPGDGTFRLPGFDLGPDGLVALELVATNCGGSVRATPVLDLDTRPPTIAIDSPPGGALFGSASIAVSGTVEDAHLDSVLVHGVEAQVDGGRFTALDVPLDEGSNSLVATATDALGRSTSSAVVTVELDTTAPSATITAPTSGTVLATPTVTVTGEASDPNLAEVRVNGVAAAISGGGFTASDVPLLEGENFLVAEAVDSLGHRAESPSVVVILDTLPPEVAIDTEALPALTAETAVTVTGSVSDPHLDTVTVNGVPATVVGDLFAAEGVPLEEGDNALVVEALDTLGHRTTSAPVSVVRDTLAPELSIDQPSPGAELTSRVISVRGTVSDPHLDAVTVAGIEAVVVDGTFTAEGVELPEGASEIVARATDLLGHAGVSDPVPVVVDTLAPVVRLDSPGDPLVTTPTVTITGRVEEPHLEAVTVAGVAAVLGTPDGETTPFSVEGVELDEGPNEITATAVDGFGHQAISEPVLYVLDTTPPEVTLETPVPGACLPAGVAVTLSGSFGDSNPAAGGGELPPAVEVEVRTADGRRSTFAGTLDADGARWSVADVDLGSADGTATAAVTATDLLGHVSRTAGSWRVDALPPAVSLELDGAPFPGAAPGASPPDGAVPNPVGRAVAAGVRVDDGPVAAPPAATLTLDGAPYAAGTPIAAEGEHLLVATATDCAGHTAAVHALFRVDTTAPALVSTAPAAGARLTDGPLAFSGVAGEALASARVDGVAATVDGATFRLTPFAWTEGDNTVEVELVDAAGNRSSHRVTFGVRTAPLRVEILEGGAPLAEGAVFLRPARPEVRPSDSRATVTATLDGAPFAPGTEVAAEGTHRLVATARDDWDRTATAEVGFTVDLGEAPTIAITAPADGETVPEPTVRVTGTVTGDAPTVTVDGVAATLSGGVWTVEALPLEPNVPNAIEAIVRDRRGRTASAVVLVQVVADGPKIAILDPPDGVLTGRDRIDVAGVVLDAERASADGIVTVTNATTGDRVTAEIGAEGTFRALDLPLAAGANSVRAEVVDHQGRPGVSEVVVGADFVPPTVTIAAAGAPLADGDAFGEAVSLTVEVSDDTATASEPPPVPVVRLNGVERPEAASPRTELAVSDEGGYVLAVVAFDRAGNETRAERSFVVDFGGCALSDVHPAAGSAVTGSSVTLAGRSGAAGAVAVRVPDGSGGAATYPALVADGTFLAGDVPLPTVGENRLVLVCTDAAGAERTAEHPIERLPEAGAPVVEIASPADGAVLDADAITVEGTVTAGTVTVNGGTAAVTIGSGADSFRAEGVTLVEGPNVVTARAVDGAGRIGSDRIVLHRDTRAPRVQITRPDHRTRIGLPATGTPAVEVAGLVDLDTEPHLQRVTVASASGEVVAAVDPATGAFVAAGVPLSATAGVDALQTLTVTATDSLGHAGTSSVGVSLDPAGPAIVLDAPQGLAYLGQDAPASLTVSGDAWATEGASVSVNGVDLDPAALSWSAPAADGRRHTVFTTGVAVPQADGAFGVIARVTEQGGAWAQDRRLLFRDTLPPEVVEMVPADGTGGVGADSLLLVLLSEPVLHGSLEAADGLTLERSATGESVVGGRTVAGQAVAFAPGAALAAGEGYRLRAGLGVTDRAGNALLAPAESSFTVAEASGAAAPSLDPPPPVLCADEITVTGAAAAGATVEVRDGDLAFRGFAGADGRFAVSVPSAGSGYHLLRVRVTDPATGAASPEATAVVRIDCSAPRVEDASFDRAAARIRIRFSEAVAPATLTVGDGASAVQLADADAPEVPRAAAVSFGAPNEAELALDDAAGAWWRDRPVRLRVGPPAADLEGNEMAAVFETVFFPGAAGGLSGGFLFGEVYDDASGRPLADASARLYTAGAALPGAVEPGMEAAPVASAATDGRGRYVFTGEVPSGRYVLLLAADGYTAVHRRLSLTPTRGTVPFDSRLTPRAEAGGTLEPATGGSVAADGLELAAAPGALSGSEPVTLHLTPLSGQGLPDFLPLGWTPAAAAEVRAEVAGAVLPTTDAGWLPGGVLLELPLPEWLTPEDELVAVRHEPAGGQWLALPAPERLAGGPDGERARVSVTGPGTVALVVADADPAVGPLVAPAVEGEVLLGAEAPEALPAFEAELSLDPPVVPPTGRSRARVIARSADAVTAWPSGVAVQAYLEEKLILAGGGGQILEAPFSADLVLYHPRLTDAERSSADGVAAAGAAGAAELNVSPSPRAAQVLLDVGYEDIRLFPFPEEVEREPVVGPPGGSVVTPEGVELTVPEGALAVKVPVSAELLDATGLAALPPVEGFDTLAAVRVDLAGRTLGRPATLSLPAPDATAPEVPGDPRLVLVRRVDDPADGRGAIPRLAARARVDGEGDAARIVASPEQAGALPLDGLVHEGLYLVLQARAPIGFATGFVRAANGTALEASRVTADGLGTADVTPAGGRYGVPVPAGAGSTLRALHPTLDEAGTAAVPQLDPGAVVALDVTVQAVPPRVLTVAPADGAVDQPVGTPVSVLLSEPLSPGTVTGSSLTLELLGPDGTATGLRVDGSVSLVDGSRIVFVPERPLLAGRSFRARFTGGVADAGGTFYAGAPVEWTFSTSTVVAPGGQVHAERFHLRVPVDGVAEIYGEPGAVPSVPAGSTPWVVTPEIEGPAADPVRDTFTVRSDGGFSGTVGHPPDFPVTMASRVWVKVFDPTGALAAELRLGPFETADGKGFVAPAGEEVVFRSTEGIEVTVPAGAFSEPTLVDVRFLDPAGLGLELPQGMELGAYVAVDFEGEAEESLVVAVPAPAAAPAGAQVFVGEPVDLPWGRRLRMLAAGAVEERADGRYLSTDPALLPEVLELADLSAGAATAATAGSTVTRSASLATKRLPKRYLRSLLQEFRSRSDAVFAYELGAQYALLSGGAGAFPLALGAGIEAIYNKLADLWVYVPAPHDWNGGFVLPVLTDQPLEVVRRDTATGWILSETAYDPIPSDAAAVDVGFLPGGAAGRPLLTDAAPFRLVRFRAPAPEQELALTLEVAAETSASGSVRLASTSAFPLAAGSSVALFDLTPALPADPEAEPAPPVAGDARVVCDPDQPWALEPMPAGEEMLLAIGPGDLDAARAGVFELQFDRPLSDLSGAAPSSVVRLLDLGPADGCAASGAAGYPRELPVVLDQAERGSRLIVTAATSLAAGHRFRLELEPAALTAAGEAPLGAWPTGPSRFDFATREVPGEAVAGMPSAEPSLGDTDAARDLLELGNLLFVASEEGDLVAIDVSDPTRTEGLHRHAIMNRASSYLRALATDGHNRIFYAGRFGMVWGLKAVRLEDAREASAECLGSPGWAAGLPCFGGVEGSVRIAYISGYTESFTASEWLAAGTLPTGNPTDLDVLTQDERGRALALADFVAAYGVADAGLAGLVPDTEGIYTFDLPVTSTLARQGQVEPSLPSGTEPAEAVAAWRERVCEGEEDYDRYQRVTVDNLTTGQSWSVDVENPWPSSSGAGDGTATIAGVRARRGDRLQVRYNLRAIGHVAIVGSGITVVDLNRFYRLTQPGQSPGGGQCGRRLGKYEGQEIEWPACVPESVGLYSGLAWTPAVEALSATGCEDGACRGAGRIDVYAPLMQIGAVHTFSEESDPGRLYPQAELAACIDTVAGVRTQILDAELATGVPWIDHGIRGEIDGTFTAPDPASAPRLVTGDLLALSLGRAGTFVFSINDRSLVTDVVGPALVGHLRVPGHSVYKLQVDPARQLLFAGGTDETTGEPVIDVWDLAAVNGAPGLAVRPEPRATLHAAWSTRDLGIDTAGTGLVYTWDDERGARAVPFEVPRFTFVGLYRPEGEEGTAGVAAAERAASRFVPLGAPLRAEPPEPEEARRDERSNTAAFRLRVALPGGLGPELTATVQSLRALPAERHLARADLGAAVLPPGGPGWPDRETVVHLRRLGVDSSEGAGELAGGEAGPLATGYHLYESAETVLLVADPRARRGYLRQDAPGTEVDEAGQCRRCTWPAYLPDPDSQDPAADEVVELLAGGYVRAFLQPSGTAGTRVVEDTRRAVEWFEEHAQSYPAPTGWAEITTPAGPVPSPLQVSLAEPAAHPALWQAGEAGVAAALTGGELLLSAADHAVAGRSIPFVFERSYRSGTLGYGPLGAAGWWSPLFARLRELPSGTVEYHDGRTRVWRFPPNTLEQPPAGYEEDPAGSYHVPQGLYVRLQRLSGGQGWVMISREHGTARFDGAGRLIEMADRHHRGGREPERGSRLRLAYDSFGQLVSVEDDLGRRYRLEYHDDPRPVAEGGDGPRYGLLRRLTDFVDREVEYRWDTERRLTEVLLPEVENPLEAYAGFSYTGTERPTLEYQYDPQAGVSASETSSSALLHGDFAALRLVSFELPTFVEGAAGVPRARFGYEAETGRLATVGFPTPGNANGGTATVEWGLAAGTGSLAGPAEQVTVEAPWGHRMEYEVTDGRVTLLSEPLEVHRPGQAPAEELVETGFVYAEDGRLLETDRPDGGRTSRCYADGEGGPGCPASAGGAFDRLARANVVALVEAAVEPGAQGTASYAEIVTTASYQGDNLPAQVTDGEGRAIDLAVPEAAAEDSSGFRAEGVSARFAYDPYGRPEQAAGGGIASPEVRFDYGADARGRVGAGLVTRIQQGSGDHVGSWRELSYDHAYNVDEMRTSFGELRRAVHDTWDRPVREESGLAGDGPLAPVGASACTAGEGAAVERAFDAAGHVVRERRLQDYVDPATGATTACRWVETRYRWNLREQLVAVERTHLADPGQPGVVLPGARKVLERSYDEHGRLERERRLAASRPSLDTVYRYDAAGRVAATRTGAEDERLLGYDAMSRVVYRTDGDRGTWRGRYDAWDRLYREELPTGAVVLTRFDRAHQPVEEQTFDGDPLGDPEARLLARTLYEVTSFGEVSRVVEELTDDGERRITERTFDGSGRVTGVWSGPEGDPGRLDPERARREAETVYEPASGRVLVQRTGGAYGGAPLVEERFGYPAAAAVPWPSTSVTLEAVPGAAELVETFTTTFERDVFGRVLSSTRSDGERRVTTWDRGSADALAVRTGAGTEERASRDGRGLPVRVERPQGRGFTLYSYDLDGLPLVRRTATADGESLWTTTTTYDATGRVAAIDHADGTREERTYHPDSQVATVRTRDGLELTFTYDAANRLEGVVPVLAEGSTAATTRLDAGDGYAYDELSRPTAMRRGRSGLQGFDPSLSVAYPSYDLASRPAAEVVGERSPLSWRWDVFDRPVELSLPEGPGRSAGAFAGFGRSYDTLDRLTSADGLGAAGLSATPLGADWSWGGSRLYAMTTRGALGTGSRRGYHGGAGPQVAGYSPDAASEWKLGRLSWGAAGTAGATAAPETPWGDFGFGWRGREGKPSDGAKVGRQVLGAATDPGVLSGLGWAWDYDAGVRLREAVPGAGDLAGQAPADGSADRFTFGYGEGDELLERLREATGEVDTFTPGDYGRLLARDGHAFAYDPVGRRLSDDRFTYRWDWRGQLVEVTVDDSWPDEDGDGEPEVSPFAGHRVRYDYDARGRLTRRLHEGVADAAGTRPFIEDRRYVWEEDRLAAEAAYGPSETGENLRWRRTYVPGPSGLDDPVQVVVEILQPGSPLTGQARTYTYLTDELGTVVGLVAEDEGTDPANPPVPLRYRYTPYGEAHAETGPELLRALFDADATAADTGTAVLIQSVADDTLAAPGGLVLHWSLPLDTTSLGTGLSVEERPTGATAWTPVPTADLAIGLRPTEGLGTANEGTALRIVHLAGWERGTSYRVRLQPTLTDRLGRLFGTSESLEWSIPQAGEAGQTPAVTYDERFPVLYESYVAAGATAGGRFPGGQSRLFQGLLTDPVTGHSYARARWLDTRNASWLTEDPLQDVDSPNLYAFVTWQPTMATDPTGEIALVDNLIGGAVSVAVGVAIEVGINTFTDDDEWDYSWKDAGVDFGLGFATSGLSSLGKLRHVKKLGTAGKAAVRAASEMTVDFTAEVARAKWKGEELSLRDAAVGAARNFLVGEAGARIGRRVGASLRKGLRPSSPGAASATRRMFVQRQTAMLRKNSGFNVSPENWFSTYSAIGRKGTSITDYSAIGEILGPVRAGRSFEVGLLPGRNRISYLRAWRLERALGLDRRTLMRGFRLTRVSDIRSRNPRSPLVGNKFFRGPGEGLPGGGPELVVDSIPTSPWP